MRRISLKDGQILYFPKDIEITHEPSFEVIKLYIKKSESNMQENAAAFEAWSLILKLRTSCKKLILSFKTIDVDNKMIFHNLSASQQHYMRFLYRLSKFQDQMSSWFSVSPESKHALYLFKEKFQEVTKVNNIPGSNSRYNEKKGDEHVIEKAFVKIPSLRKKTGIAFELFDQLPNGLFAKKVCKENKIFNTGYFDLWGKDPVNQTFVLFELKEPENTKLGIISELFFYANFAFDLLHERENITLNKSKNKYRNYQTFLTLKNAQVKAYFLVNKLHSEFEKHQIDLLTMLNDHSPVSYGIINYTIDAQSLSSIKSQLNDIYQGCKCV